MEDTQDLKSIEVDFGEVEVGVTRIKSIKIVNNSNNEQTYVVQRDFISNPLDCVFNTIDYTWSLMPCESYVCDISYRPVLPNYKYTDYFYITDTYNCCYKITVRGCSTAVNVTSSCTRLIVICNKNCSANKCVKLTNNAMIPAKFTFDVDVNQCPFKVSQLSGIIKPLSTKSIDISFQPNDTGIYKYHMPCLILHQNPIIFELYGLCEMNQREIRHFLSVAENIPELDQENSFTSYMNDTTAILKNEPPTVSLSWSFVDFGEVEVGPKNSTKRTPQTVCLTNNSSFEILVLWEKDSSDVFNIHPQEARVTGDQSIIFEVRFDPKEKCRFYYRELLARVFQIPCCTRIDEINEQLLMEVIPEFVSIRFIGHTCHNSTNDWIPQYEIPEMMIMPACVPALPIYNTFIISNFGQQPLMFHFIPPSTSHFSIKPMIGLITHEQEYQVIVVELFPEACTEPAYVERWALQLNGSLKNEIYLDLQGFAELGNLLFENDNTITFDPVYFGCSQTRAISVRNLSRHVVRYEYLADLPKELCIEQITGCINPNEMIYHDWTFKPDEMKCYEFDVSCRSITNIGGRCCVTQIEASGSCTEGSLMAIPEELNFGTRLYKETCQMDFRIFNFSAVKIHFRLSCRPSKSLEIMENPEKDLTMSPSCGSVETGKVQEIQVVLNPKCVGFYELTIEYTVISNATEDVLLPLTDSKSLCRVTCFCYLPSLEVKDLLYRVDANVGISKISLWKSLSIDSLNLALKETQPREERLIQMKVPYIGPNETLVVKLLLVNTSPIDVSCSLKKENTCFCNDSTVKTLIKNSRNQCSKCVDDQSIEIYPNKMKLTPNETCILTIIIKACPLHSGGLYWDLNIGNERCITININIEDSFILPSPYLKFKTVDIKEITRMRYEMIWLYNDSKDEVSYKIKTKALSYINKKNYTIVFNCLNPEGKIQGLEKKPILFGFCPNKFGNYEADLLVRLDYKEASLEIQAECTNTLTEIKEHEKCPQSDTFKTSDIVAYFNNDYMILPPIPKHGKMNRIFVLHNHHRNNVLSYKWNNYEIPDVISVKINPASGLIQAQSILTFIVEVSAYSYECLLDIDVYCQFVDMTEKRLAERKREEQDCILKNLDNEFTIDEKGLSYPKKPIFEPIKEPLTFWKALTLKIDVRDFYDSAGNVDVERQLKTIPDIEEISYKRNSDKKLAPDIVRLSSSIFENIVWEIVNNGCFFKMADNNLAKPHKLKYSRLPICFKSECEKLLMPKRLDWIPSKKLTNDVLRNMIRMITHEEFNLDTSHFSHPPDTRQISYQKICMEAFYKQALEAISLDTLFFE